MSTKPPYTITEKAADYLAKTVEAVTRLEVGTGFKRDIKLHRQNRMQAIHSSLAIEGNTMTLEEVTALIDGKLVAGKQAESKEVKNAYEAYDQIMTFNPYSVGDFLKAHKLVTNGLIKESGVFRSSDVGVFDKGIAVHVGARPQFVPQLISDLFSWAEESVLHPVLKSAILHCEIEIIHPFADGNGRMGRLWQALTLAKWNELFSWIPMESVLYQNQYQYYQAIEEARVANDSGAFIEFTLSALLESVNNQAKQVDKHIVEHKDNHKDKHKDEHRDVQPTDTMVAVLKALEARSLSRAEIFVSIGLKNDYRSFKRHIEPLLTNGFIQMTIPDKPSSKLQRYRLTDRG